MPESNRSGDTLVGLALGVGIALNAVIWVPMGYHWFSDNTRSHKYEYAADRCAEQHPEYAFAGSPILKGDQAVSAPDQDGDAGKANDNIKGEQPNWCDLAAQQSMADSTVWIMMAAVISIPLTIFGIFLVWRNLVVTREMALDSRAIGEKQIKAYLSINEVIAEIEIVGTGSVTCLFHIELKNTGASPARDVILSLNGWYQDGRQDSLSIGDIAAGSTSKELVLGSIDEGDIAFIDNDDTVVAVGPKFLINYTDVFDKDHFFEQEFSCASKLIHGTKITMRRTREHRIKLPPVPI